MIVNDERASLADWICGAYGNAWRAVAVLDLSNLSPGAHDVELTLRRHPPVRLTVHRLVAHRS